MYRSTCRRGRIGPCAKRSRTSSGKRLPDAVSALNGSHLRLIYIKRPVRTRADVGKIIQQTPLSGGQAPQNAQILVFLGVLKSATSP